MALMGGLVRPVLAAAMVGFGVWLLWRHARNGWRLEAVAGHTAHIEET